LVDDLEVAPSTAPVALRLLMVAPLFDDDDRVFVASITAVEPFEAPLKVELGL